MKQLYTFNYNKALHNFPTGFEMFWRCTSIPAAWIAQEGELLQISRYKNLYVYALENNMIVDEEAWQSEKLYGLFSFGDGKTTFRVPDLRGLSFVGFEENYHKKIGQYLQDQIVNITGSWVGGRNANEGVSGCVYGGAGYGTYSGGKFQMAPKYIDVSRVVNTGERVQTRSVAGKWIIKAI